MIDLILAVIFVGGPLLLGYFVGSYNERKHYASLEEREKEFTGILVSDQKRLPEGWNPTEGTLVTGSVVIATDYFKTFAAGLRNLFGGRIVGYERLMERARREAILRMLEEAKSHSANVVWNVRVQTSTIGQGPKQNAAGMEVVAYGTALRVG